MKNHEEFRQIVFEKAKIYEEKRKKRRKKIIEAASLCSLCVVIGISAYLGLDNLHLMEEADQISVTEAKSHMENASDHPEVTPTHGEETNATQAGTGAAPTSTAAHTFSSTVSPAETTTHTISTSESTMEETTEATVATSTRRDETSICATVIEEPTEITEESFILLGEFEYGQTDFSEASPRMILCVSLQSLEYVIENTFPYISSEGLSFLRGSFEEAYFDDHSLILVFSSDAWLWEATLADGVFTYSAIDENPNGSGRISLFVYSVPTNVIMTANFSMENNE